ncbi:MAG: dihydroorotate dehydrogenase electron transfer subunit [Ruminococcus sp.]|jgi:dihydroorotate dehydrogenase electron transfer subunit|nr:dihydroorotate dehydrogenase electron transfer subunit [Ruminococcus sp.]
MFKNTYKIISLKKLTETVYDVSVEAPDIAAAAKPGQFLQVTVPGFFLPRPISICDVNGTAVRFVFEVRGGGTAAIADSCGEITLFGPLGNGFPENLSDICVVGGGIGTPPLLFCAARFDVKKAILGYRSRTAVILKDDFAKITDTEVTTDDGSCGTSGYAPEALKKHLETNTPGAVFACGPGVMLNAVAKICSDAKISAYLSTEERMACAAGACLGCAIKTRSGMKRVCKDGPVFAAGEITLN